MLERRRRRLRREVGSTMKKYRTRRRSPARILVRLIAPVLVFAGLLIFGYSVLIGDPLASATLFTTGAPDNSTLKLTVPEMQRVNNVPVYDGPANDEAALHDGTLHLRGTGFPWQQGANVYIAGHRLGFPGTKSYLVFWDLNKLENGDEVILTDANGTRYTYEVFKEFVVNPGDTHVTRPLAGRNVVTLQTCTLPDYSQRLIVQAELTSVS
jgi:sortase A